jgi:hypothetical protein
VIEKERERDVFTFKIDTKRKLKDDISFHKIEEKETKVTYYFYIILRRISVDVWLILATNKTNVHI